MPYSLITKPSSSWSLVAKPSGTARDGAWTDPTLDGAYTEPVVDGAYTDPGDGWAPVVTRYPTYSLVAKPS